MALVVGTNSWATVAEADTYFATRMNSEAWTTLAGVPQKETALITAFHWINDDQNYNTSPTDTAEYLKRAQFEAALFLLESYDDYRSRSAMVASGIKSFRRGRWAETLTALSKPKIVDDILSTGGSAAGHEFPILETDED